MSGILGKKLRRARENLGLTQEELSRAVGLSSEFISLLEIGKRTPSLESLRKLAKFLKKDVAFFMEEKEAAFVSLLKDKKLNREAKAEIRNFKKYCENYLKLEELTGRRLEVAPLYSSVTPERMALEERQRLGLGDEPIRDIFALLEINGLRFLRQAVPDKAKIAGLFVFYEAEQSAFAMVNSSFSLGEQSMMAAHLYCHYLKDRLDGPILDNPDIYVEDYLPLYHPREKYAQRFAWFFLMPVTKMQHIITKELHVKSLHYEDVIFLKRYFGVNTLTLLQHLFRWDLLSSQRYSEYLEIDHVAFEKSLFGDVVADRKPTKARAKTLTSDRQKVLGVSAYQKSPSWKE